MATAGTLEHLCSPETISRHFISFSYIEVEKKSFFVGSHKNIFDINYSLSMQGHNNMDNDEYQVFFKGWRSASSTHLPRSDFLILRKNSLFIECRDLRLSARKSCHSEMNEHNLIENIANTEPLCLWLCICFILDVHGEWH